MAGSPLAETIAQLERRFGPGTIYRLSQAKPKVGTLVLETGMASLDQATGIGGIPRGRITELFGPPSCGKTSLAYQIVANAQRDGGMAAFIDAGQIMDGEAMLLRGVNLNDLLVVVPANAKEAFEITEILVRCQTLDAVVLAALGGFTVGRDEARHVSEAMRKINAMLKGSATALVFVQERNLIKGGLQFYASLRVGLTPVSALRDAGRDVIGLRVKAKVIKNKLAGAGGEGEFIVRERELGG